MHVYAPIWIVSAMIIASFVFGIFLGRISK